MLIDIFYTSNKPNKLKHYDHLPNKVSELYKTFKCFLSGSDARILTGTLCSGCFNINNII